MHTTQHSLSTRSCTDVCCHQVWEGPWAWRRGWHAISSQSGQVGSQEGRAETRFPLLKVPLATRQRKIRRQEGGRPPESTPAPEIARAWGAELGGSAHYRTMTVTGHSDIPFPGQSLSWTVSHASCGPAVLSLPSTILLPAPPPHRGHCTPTGSQSSGQHSMYERQCGAGAWAQPAVAGRTDTSGVPAGRGRRGPESCQLDTISRSRLPSWRPEQAVAILPSPSPSPGGSLQMGLNLGPCPVAAHQQPSVSPEALVNCWPHLWGLSRPQSGHGPERQRHRKCSRSYRRRGR